MQKQEKGSPPQFMSTHPSVSKINFIVYLVTNVPSRATTERKLFVDGKMLDFIV